MIDCMKTMIQAAKAAGDAIIRGVEHVNIIGPDKKALHPHTDTDLAADDAIRRVLMPCMGPDVGLLTEERLDNAERLGKKRVFIIDPIDGTHSLIEGTQDAVVSIALAGDGRVIRGVVFNPFTGELWTATRGRGAFLNNRRLKVEDCNDLSRAEFLMSNTENRTGQLHAFEGRIKFTIRGSIAYKCALVAAGMAQGHFTVNPRSEWDIAAASLIMEEAGGLVTDRWGTPILFNNENPIIDGVICVVPGLMPGLLELIKDVSAHNSDRGM